MLNSNDIKFMTDSICDIISEWNTFISIFTPLPISQQPNYNTLMNEYSGPIVFVRRVVPAERKDIVNNYTNYIQPDEIAYGDKNEGVLLYAVPTILTSVVGGIVVEETYKPQLNATISVDNSADRYFIKSMRDRIGETLLLLNRYVGGTVNGTKEPDVIIEYADYLLLLEEGG